MSADAKLWTTETGWWQGLHDGDCVHSERHHRFGDYHLSVVMADIEQCTGKLRWVQRAYPKLDNLGLSGYVV